MSEAGDSLQYHRSVGTSSPSLVRLITLLKFHEGEFTDKPVQHERR
jgi:hypothetical protein